ncbi:potassium channel family protein [Flavisphingomonas formosensis]|uniref:potassium channel family protein n=1 Tax=Flavisphingomonas formosensis TaxID=861534 RepID=UPI001E3C701B|nr:potassium channel protein [Sphingomonas formosensis]
MAGLSAERVLQSPVRNLASIILFVSIVMAIATTAYMAAGWPFLDALYMVMLTIYTVGYGEVRPIDTPYLHVVTIGTMVLGCTGMILLTGALVQVFTAVQLKEMFGQGRMKSKVDHLDGHVIVCGFGRIGAMLAKDLATARVKFVVLERGAARLAEAEALGYLCLSGDATDETVLLSAGVARARTLATVLPDDAANVFITLSARSLNPAIEIIARGEAPTTESKLIHAGANKVVLPTHIGAERIAEMIIHPQAMRLVRESDQMQALERSLGSIGLDVGVVAVPPNGGLTGATVGEAERRGAGRFLIVRIERAGGEEAVDQPAPGIRIEAGDSVVIVLRGSKAEASALFAPPQDGVRAGRTVVR